MYFQEFYNKLFSSSRLQTHSGLDLSDDSMEAGLNLFFIPRVVNEGTVFRRLRIKALCRLNSYFSEEPTIRQNRKKLMEKLKTKIHGVARNPMTPTTLTEKNW